MKIHFPLIMDIFLVKLCECLLCTQNLFLWGRREIGLRSCLPAPEKLFHLSYNFFTIVAKYYEKADLAVAWSCSTFCPIVVRKYSLCLYSGRRTKQKTFQEDFFFFLPRSNSPCLISFRKKSEGKKNKNSISGEIRGGGDELHEGTEEEGKKVSFVIFCVAGDRWRGGKGTFGKYRWWKKEEAEGRERW